MAENEDDFLPRHLAAELSEALATARIVNLVGPRQVGKTTLVRDLFGRGSFISLDDATTLSALETDPDGQLETLAADPANLPIVIDEAQRSKALALAIKRIVDQNRRKGQFVLTGSSNVFTTAEVADSLAGRMRTLKLWPLTMAEVHRKPVCRLLDWAVQPTVTLDRIGDPDALSRTDYIDLMLAGGYPEMRTLSPRARNRQYRDYVDAVVERDVADILRIRKTDQLRRLIDQMAARTAFEINVSELSGLLGIKRATVDQYLDVLMRLSLIIKLGAWTSGEPRREIKNPKFHFVDTGVDAALRRMNGDSFNALANAAALGGIVETFVFNELNRALPLQDDDFRLYHWRSPDQREVDIIIDGGASIIGVEVKASVTVTADDFRHLNWFAEAGPAKRRAFTGIVFYLGRNKVSFGDRRFALPVSTLWSRIDLAPKASATDR